jgi:hypothetical protein
MRGRTAEEANVVIEIVQPVLRCMQHLHSKGITHGCAAFLAHIMNIKYKRLTVFQKKTKQRPVSFLSAAWLGCPAATGISARTTFC